MKPSLLWLAVACGLWGCGDDHETPGTPSSMGGSPGAGTGGDVGGTSGGTESSGGGTGGMVGGAGASAVGGTAGAVATGGAGAGGESGEAGQAEGGAAGEADGGEPGASGEGGEAGEPGIVERVESVPADKIDLLFVIDNSLSMADKQAILRDAVPLLVQRLVTPVCVDAAGTPTGVLSDESGDCSAGEPEFPPIRDIHIAMVSSSLGTNGGEVCTDGGPQDDHAELIGTLRPGLSSWNDSGFLAWDPDGDRNDPAGEGDASALVGDFQDMIVGVGEEGCGYEATLEAWYRFLVDPEPPSEVTLDEMTRQSAASYPDETILAQRAAFLRPDSLVGIVMLSDENDCSIVDFGQGWIVGLQNVPGGGANDRFRMPRATSTCETDPNDACCQSCSASSVPGGCTAPASDPSCQTNNGTYTAVDDSINLRCFAQQRRFGFDLLFPITRYVDGLTATLVPDREGGFVENPLFHAEPEMPGRDASRVFLVGILGVPWQDVADEESLSDSAHLAYLSHDELVAEDRWSLILGDAADPPEDGLMLETPLDRSTLDLGPHPLTGDEIAPSSSTDPEENPINGHEVSIMDGSSLQYTCIFPLQEPRDCELDTDSSCDCHAEDAVYNSPLCQPPGGGAPSTTQYWAKAYPGQRQLEVLYQLGQLTGNSVVASICPKVFDSDMPLTDPAYGYNPAMTAMVDRMKAALAPACLADALEVDADGRVTGCGVLEVVLPPTGGACAPCDGAGHADPDVDAADRLLSQLEASRFCGDDGQPPCEDLCVCELTELEGQELSECQTEATVSEDLAGYCYLDEEADVGDPELVSYCPVGRKRRLRFVGEEVPVSGARTFVLCE